MLVLKIIQKAHTSSTAIQCNNMWAICIYIVVILIYDAIKFIPLESFQVVALDPSSVHASLHLSQTNVRKVHVLL